jgi:hypothetical protein
LVTPIESFEDVWFHLVLGSQNAFGKRAPGRVPHVSWKSTIVVSIGQMEIIMKQKQQ